MRVLMGRWIAIFLLVGWWAYTAPASLLAHQALSTPEASPAAEESPTIEAPRFSITPVGDFENRYFDIMVNAGDTVQLTARILNSGAVPATLRTFATSAYNPENGGFVAATDEDELTGAALWVDFPGETLTLEPQDERIIDFAVTVPTDAPAGEYVAALVVQTDESLEIPGSDNFRQILRHTVSIEITIPGEMTTGFELDTPAAYTSGGNWVLDVPITNTGTARVRPQGELVVMSPEGQVVSSTDVEMGSVYGGNSTTVRVFLPRQLPLGDYLVSLHLTDEQTGTSAAIEDAPIFIEHPEAQQEEEPPFVVDETSVVPNGEPVQYADVAAVITNNGSTIPTANVTLNVQRDGEEVESYPLAQNQALPQGTTDFGQRYIPVDGWQPGTYTFELVISAVSGGTETILATVVIPDEIVVP